MEYKLWNTNYGIQIMEYKLWNLNHAVIKLIFISYSQDLKHLLKEAG